MSASAPLFTEESIAAYLDGEMDEATRRAFERELQNHPEWRVLVSEQAEVIAALKPLRVKPPKAEVWDGYWERIDARLERRIGTIVVLGGAAVFALAGAAILIHSIANPILEAAAAIVALGLLFLFVLVLRGRLREAPKDRYLRIRR